MMKKKKKLKRKAREKGRLTCSLLDDLVHVHTIVKPAMRER